jgi:hypothetical protein
MLCERSYDPLSRMLLKGDEGGCKIRRGVAENGDFRQGGSLPLDDLSVTSNRDGSFFIFLTSLFSSLHYLGRSNKLHATLRCRVDYVQNGA